jgi:hypothetical protein
MLVVAVCKAKESSTTAERITRRAQWSYPEGTNVIAEYWLQSNDPAIPTVISVFEADDVSSLMAGLAAWDKDFEMTYVPAVSAEEGLSLAQQMMQQ